MNPRDWLQNLAPRERRLVYLAAGLAAVAAIYMAVVMPLNGMNARSAARVAKKTADLAWMQQAAPQVMAASASTAGATATDESLVVLVDRTGRESGLGASVRDQSPSGEHGLRLRLEGAPFDVLVTWLAILQQRYGVAVEAATIDAAPAPGLVNASLTLTHGAPVAP
jgi:general secretion pathway protein M